MSFMPLFCPKFSFLGSLGRRNKHANVEFYQYETPSDDVRRIFEEHGEIKTFFDLISTRGMVFVTYVSSCIVRRLPL